MKYLPRHARLEMVMTQVDSDLSQITAIIKKLRIALIDLKAIYAKNYLSKQGIQPLRKTYHDVFIRSFLNYIRSVSIK